MKARQTTVFAYKCIENLSMLHLTLINCFTPYQSDNFIILVTIFNQAWLESQQGQFGL